VQYALALKGRVGEGLGSLGGGMLQAEVSFRQLWDINRMEPSNVHSCTGLFIVILVPARS